MERRPLGATGLSVSAVGLGAGGIGGPEMSEAEVDRLVGSALDAGVTLFDTARSYGLSEERLGRALAGRRDEVVLSTKVGYGISGIPDWSAPVIPAGVDEALRRLRTDRIDVVHLHSCPLDVLERSDVSEALVRCVESGKVRVAAYSGEGDALLWAIRSGAFGSVQCSVSVVDQGPLESAVADACSRKIGVLAKRPLGNAPWRFDARPPEPDVAEAWHRFKALRLDPAGLDWPTLFARFAAFAPGVSAILMGTRSSAHLAETVAAVEDGSLDSSLVASLCSAFAREGARWPGRI